MDYVEFPNPIAAASTGPVQLSFGNGATPAGAMSAVVAPSTLSGGPSESVSMFPSGNDLVVAIDPATLPANIGPITIWVEDIGGIPIVVGTVNPGVNPMVIKHPKRLVRRGFFLHRDSRWHQCSRSLSVMRLGAGSIECSIRWERSMDPNFS